MTNAPAESARIRALRRWYHRYRDGNLRIEHPMNRRLLQAFMPRHVRVTLSNGIRLELDLTIAHQRTIFWLDGDIEPHLSWAIRELLPNGGTFVDCGANTGYFGLEAHALKQARVLFIEPHPRLAGLVDINIGLNGWQGSCFVIDVAASDQPGSETLFMSRRQDGAHSLLSDWVQGNHPRDRMQVKVARLDDILQQRAEFSRVDFMKVDTEGHDLKALQGLGGRLHPERVACLYTKLGRDRAEAVRLLRRCGYVGFLVRGFRNGVEMWRTARRAESGAPVCFFVPDVDFASLREILWCGKGSPAEARLRDLARSREAAE